MGMDSQSPVMVVVPDEGDRLFANQLANAMGFTTAEVVVGDVADAAVALGQREGSPHYIVVDIGGRGVDVLSDLDRMAEHCEPSVRVVVIGTVNDVGFYRELRGRGIAEYFPKPAKIAEIRSALMTQSGPAGTPTAARAQVISFMSAASGDGSSTVAINTAYCLSHEFKQPTVVVDMDFQFGMIAKNLDLNSNYGIRELFEHPDRGIDNTLIERMLVEYRPNLKLIAAPNDLRLLPSVRPEVIRDLILTLQEKYKYVIIDLPHIWTPWIAAALSHSTHQVMVAQLWLRSAAHAARLLGSWSDIGIDRGNVTLAINRSGAKFKEAVDVGNFEKICGRKISAFLPNETRTIVEAENMGQTVMEVNKSSSLSRAVHDLAYSFLPDNLKAVYAPSTEAPAINPLMAALSKALGAR